MPVSSIGVSWTTVRLVKCINKGIFSCFSTSAWVGLQRTLSSHVWNVEINCASKEAAYQNLDLTSESVTKTAYTFGTNGLWSSATPDTMATNAVCRRGILVTLVTCVQYTYKWRSVNFRSKHLWSRSVPSLQHLYGDKQWHLLQYVYLIHYANEKIFVFCEHSYCVKRQSIISELHYFVE